MSSFQNLDSQEHVDVDKFIQDNQQTFTAKVKEEQNNAITSTNLGPMVQPKGLT